MSVKNAPARKTHLEPTLSIADDHVEILRVLSLYCHLADDRAGDRLPEVFAQDATLQVTLTGPFQGIAAITDYYMKFVPSQPVATIGHYTMDSVIDLDADGKTAQVRSKGIGVRQDMGYVLSEYRDVFAKTAAGWRIQKRQIIRRTRFSTDPVV